MSVTVESPYSVISGLEFGLAKAIEARDAAQKRIDELTAILNDPNELAKRVEAYHKAWRRFDMRM